MNTEAKKLKLIQRILLTRDEALLEALEKLIESREEGSAPDLESAIAEGLEDIKAGRTYANEDVQEYVKKKYGL